MQLPPELEPALAHQGGWDEILIIGAPIALFLFFRWFAGRRQQREETEEDSGA